MVLSIGVINKFQHSFILLFGLRIEINIAKFLAYEKTLINHNSNSLYQ